MNGMVNRIMVLADSSPNDDDDDEERPTESRNIRQDNQSLLTWNISLTDDQDEVSENLLMMHDEPTREDEKLFGPGILAVPENIRKQVDEILKHSEIDPNTLFNFGSVKSSWIMQFSYQQYLKFLSQRELEKTEMHVLHPWTQWKRWPAGNTTPPPPGTTPSPSSFSSLSSLSLSMSSSSAPVSDRSPFPTHRRHSPPPPSSSTPAPASDLSSFLLTFHHRSPSLSPLYAFGRSFDDPRANGSFESFGRRDSVTAAAAAAAAAVTSITDSPSPSSSSFSSSSSWSSSSTAAAAGVRASTPQQLLFARLSRPPPPQPQPQPQTQSQSQPPSSRGARPRLYYSVDADNNNVVVTKLVEHYCTFCYKNREPPEVYGTHLVRDGDRTTCPKLRALRCKRCNGTGDNAHTIKYCPCLYINYCG